MALSGLCRGFSRMMRCDLMAKTSLCRELIQKSNVSRSNGFLSVCNTTLAFPCSILQRNMATLNQMHRKGPLKPKKKKPRAAVLEGCPQKRGVILKVMIKKPKKPNSANRKCVRLRLSNGKECVAYIPGEGHNLQEHHIVLVEGGRLQDVPGVKVKCVRGKYDLAHVKKDKK